MYVKHALLNLCIYHGLHDCMFNMCFDKRMIHACCNFPYVDKVLCIHQQDVSESWATLDELTLMTAVTPTDGPKSVRNRCVIKVFGGDFLCCHVACWIFLWV